MDAPELFVVVVSLTTILELSEFQAHRFQNLFLFRRNSEIYLNALDYCTQIVDIDKIDISVAMLRVINICKVVQINNGVQL